jgi:transcriptional regulator NrdR family protein
MQLKVIKSDGGMEEYLHTKVIGTLSNALGLVDDMNIFAAEQFAEAITFYLYEKRCLPRVSSEEIHLMVLAVLASTGYEHAGQALKEHRLNRKLRRSRVEVVDDGGLGAFEGRMTSRWDKSRIVGRLMRSERIDRQIARAIAASVEEKILNLNMTRVPAMLVRQLVLADTEAMLAAQRQLQMVAV